MKEYLVIIVTITLISNTQCGLIDGLFGAVKNTTNIIKNDISGVVNYGKNVVFGNNKAPDEREATERSLPTLGLIDNLSLKIHDAAAGVREHVRSAIAIFDKDENGNGFVGRMFERMKSKIIKVKGFFLNDNKAQYQNYQNGTLRPSREVTVLTEKLKQYVFRNNSSSNGGLRQTLHSLTEVVEKLRNNVTKHRKEEEENDGTGLIDVRMAVDDLAGDVHDPASDKFDDEIIRPGINLKTL